MSSFSDRIALFQNKASSSNNNSKINTNVNKASNQNKVKIE